MSALYPLTYAEVGMEEAEAQLGLAKIILDDLLDGFRERLDSADELQDRIRELHEVLATAARVAAMDRPGGGLSSGRGLQRFGLPHGDSPSMGGSATPTVGAPGATRQPVAPGNPGGGIA